jgi:hypothetical protein
MPVLADGLKSEHSIDRANAAYAIGGLGKAGSEALSLLEELLKDECVAPRCEAASAITKITGDPLTEISVGVDLLDAVDWIDRYVGAEHLGGMGIVAAPALPDLRRARSQPFAVSWICRLHRWSTIWRHFERLRALWCVVV